MKKDIKLQWGFIFSIISFALSVVTMIIFFIKVTPNSVVDISTFIGAIAAFIGISVTLIIGFQIYSIIDIKSKMADIDSLKEELVTTRDQLMATKQDLSLLEIELRGQMLLNESQLSLSQEKFHDSFEKIQNALVYFAKLDKQKTVLSTYLRMLSVCASSITKDEFVDKVLIDVFIHMIDNNHIHLKKAQYYWAIKEEYEDIYNDVRHQVLSFKQA